MENNSRYLEMCGAGERSGLYYTCINSHLTTDELAYIVNNSDSRVFITSREKLDVAREVVALCPDIERWLVVDGPADEAPFEDYLDRRLRLPGHPDRRRAAGRGDALLVRHDRPAQGHRAPARRRLARPRRWR